MPKTLARKRRREEHVVQAPIEVRTSPDGKVGIRGYAAVFEAESWGEVIKRGAFNRALAADANVDLLINHEGLPLATTKAGTMTLSVDDHGLLVEAPDLDMDNPAVQELVSGMRRGDVDKMSFAGIFQNAQKVDGIREVREVDIWDVSIVTRPWYDDTEVGIRSLSQRDVRRLSSDEKRQCQLPGVAMRAALRAAPAGATSWIDRTESVWDALEELAGDYVCIVDIADGWVVWACWAEWECLYQSNWSIDSAGTVTVEPGIRVALTYVPADDPAAAAIEPEDSSGDMTDRGMSLNLARAYAASGRLPA